MKIHHTNNSFSMHRRYIKITILFASLLIFGVIIPMGLSSHANIGIHERSDMYQKDMVNTANWYYTYGADIYINNSDTDFSNDWDDYSDSYEWCYWDTGENAWVIEQLALDANIIVIESNKSFIIQDSLIQNVVQESALNISNSDNLIVRNTTVLNSEGWGFNLQFCTNISINNNRFVNISDFDTMAGIRGGRALELMNCNYINVTNTIFRNQTQISIIAQVCNFLNLGNNSFCNCKGGSYIASGGYINIFNNTFNKDCPNDSNECPECSSGPGFSVFGANNIIIENNSIYKKQVAINLGYNTNCSIKKNTVFNNSFGIAGVSNTNVKIIDNKVGNNSANGIRLEENNNVTLSDNQLFNKNTISLLVSNGAIFEYEIENKTNYIDGNPILVFQNRNGLHSNDFMGAGQVFLLNCSDNILEEISNPLNCYHCNDTVIEASTIEGYQTGFYLEYCRNITISNCDLSSNFFGIESRHNYNCTFMDNNIYSNNHPISLSFETSISIHNNTIENTWLNPSETETGAITFLECNNTDIFLNKIYNTNGHGIFADQDAMTSINSLNMTIYDNEIVNATEKGFYIDGMDDSTIFNNTFENCDTGVHLNIGVNVLFYGNEFLNNSVQAIESFLYCNGYWNDSKIGNYWDDYIGDDDDEDGIGDNPYSFAGGTDYLPIYRDTTPPQWDPIPEIPPSEYKTPVYYDANATDDYSDIDSYWLNDTDYFEIDPEDGTLTNNTLVPAGIYWLELSVNDTAGNVNTTVINITIIDTTPPVISIDSPLSQPYTTDIITVSLSGDADTYWYYIEGVDSNNQTWTEDTDRTLDDGIYTLYAYGNDTAGNDAAPQSTSFEIDTTAPYVSLNTPNDRTYYTQDITINATITGADIDEV
ncbi:MAG: hypothetical protein EU548_10150, partial [Promethearchaeota archaeon]